MKKKHISPQITIYRDYIPNVDEVLLFLKKTQNKEIQSLFVKEWLPWAETGFVSESPYIESFFYQKFDDAQEEQFELLFNLNKIIKKIIQEYINEWKDVGYWKFEIKDWSMDKEHSVLYRMPTSYLMHGVTNSKNRLAMSYHTDHHQYDQEARGNHHLITIILYLNDDYENGELSFINENDFSINYVKPKKGDVFVFPSFYPWFHGVEPITNGQKYFMRTFIGFSYEGSKKWNLSNERMPEKWPSIEANRIRAEWNHSKYFRVPVFKDDSENDIEFLHINVGNIIPFPYTRKECKEKFMIKWED